MIHANFLPTRINSSCRLPANFTLYIGCSGVKAKKAAGARRQYNDAATLASAVLDQWNTDETRISCSLGELIHQPSFDIDRFIGILSAIDQRLALRMQQFFNEVMIYIPNTIRALAIEDYRLLGEMVDASQKDAERCLGNQIEETICLAASARELGAVAASAFGAGFGGAVWALVEREQGSTFVDRWSRQFRRRFPDQHKARFFEEKTGPAAHHVGIESI